LFLNDSTQGKETYKNSTLVNDTSALKSKSNRTRFKEITNEIKGTGKK